ncbi:hypothetical protein AA098_14760 [Pseudomonas sp. JY-Q]|uniref:hypothetical protein n=1 Tax=Pseudomonas sp. JY-Q TaxID=1338689 RepID=UPI0007DE233F|nr:hypothetical protein [Pseudomonas sp. JY-Q]ANI34674.1 hypothetical protein AA098_14760 [Pseudomonas sp. JY-Q]
MNAPNRHEAIRLAQQRISELEQEISVLQEREKTPDSDFSLKLTKLMRKYRLSAEEVIALLLARGDVDQKSVSLETVLKLRYILGLKDVQASHSSEKPFRVRGWVNVDVE